MKAWRRLLVAPGLGACLLALAAAGEDFEFMPKGGRVLLLEAVGTAAAQLRPLVQTRRTEAQWREFVDAQRKPMSDRERATLAAYLAVNTPLAGAFDSAKQLPRDGRDLAWEECQSCHSLFSSHLTQSRSAQHWRNMFMSPFHRELKMTPQEREEFARYSELNMPMQVEDVPPDLRF